MAKNKRKRKQKQLNRKKEGPPREDRRAEAVTVAWMLCVIATLGAQIVAGVGFLLIGIAPRQEEIPQTLQAFPVVMLFAAVVTAVVSLLLILPTYRFRQVAPPRLITSAAVVIAVVSIAAVVWLSLR